MKILFLSCCPIVRKERLTLFSLKDRSGVRGDFNPVSFKKEILWLRQSISRIFFSHGGKVIKAGATTNDHNGYLTSTDLALESAHRECERYAVGRKSSLQVTILVDIEEVPVQLDMSADGQGWNGNVEMLPAGRLFQTRYVQCPDDWHIYDGAKIKVYSNAKNLTERIDVKFRSVKTLHVIEKYSIWSSMWEDGEYQSRMEHLRKLVASDISSIPSAKIAKTPESLVSV